MTIPEQAVAVGTLPERLRKYRTHHDLMTPCSVAEMCDEAARAIEAALMGVQRPEDVARADDRRHAKCLRDDVEKGVFPFGELMLNERKTLAAALNAYALPHTGQPQEGQPFACINWAGQCQIQCDHCAGRTAPQAGCAKEGWQELLNAAIDYADYHSDYDDLHLTGIASGAITDPCHTDKTARLILATRALVAEERDKQ